MRSLGKITKLVAFIVQEFQMFVVALVFFIMKKEEQGRCVSILSLLTGVALIAVSKLEFDKKLIESKY